MSLVNLGLRYCLLMVLETNHRELTKVDSAEVTLVTLGLRYCHLMVLETSYRVLTKVGSADVPHVNLGLRYCHPDGFGDILAGID